MDGKKNVYIWDMDETLILIQCLLNGTYSKAFDGLKDVQKGIEIGKTWENYILQVCDEHFYYEQIENHNSPSLNALAQYDDGRDLSDYDFNQDGFSSLNDDSSKRKLAYRHRTIAHKYKQGLLGILGQEKVKLLDDLYDVTDSYTGRWFSSARTFLEGLSGGIRDSNACAASVNGIAESIDAEIEHIHVLVTSGSLIPSLAKCLLFRLDRLITHENASHTPSSGQDPHRRRATAAPPPRHRGCSNARICKTRSGVPVPLHQAPPFPCPPHRRCATAVAPPRRHLLPRRGCYFFKPKLGTKSMPLVEEEDWAKGRAIQLLQTFK